MDFGIKNSVDASATQVGTAIGNASVRPHQIRFGEATIDQEPQLVKGEGVLASWFNTIHRRALVVRSALAEGAMCVVKSSLAKLAQLQFRLWGEMSQRT